MTRWPVWCWEPCWRWVPPRLPRLDAPQVGRRATAATCAASPSPCRSTAAAALPGTVAAPRRGAAGAGPFARRRLPALRRPGPGRDRGVRAGGRSRVADDFAQLLPGLHARRLRRPRHRPLRRAQLPDTDGFDAAPSEGREARRVRRPARAAPRLLRHARPGRGPGRRPRAALGYDKVAISRRRRTGRSIAIAYALAHPDRVERMLLDIARSPAVRRASSPTVASRLPARCCALLRVRCLCRRRRRTSPADVVAVANALAARPVRGRCGADGSIAPRDRPLGLTTLVVESRGQPGARGRAPVRDHAARLGDRRAAAADLRTPCSAAPDGLLARSSPTSRSGLATVPRRRLPLDGGHAGRRAGPFAAGVDRRPARGVFGPFGRWAGHEPASPTLCATLAESGGRRLAPAEGTFPTCRCSRSRATRHALADGGCCGACRALPARASARRRPASGTAWSTTPRASATA